MRSFGIGIRVHAPAHAEQRKRSGQVDPNKEIDLEQVDRMIGHALDNGVNYFDTAYPYHGGKAKVFWESGLKVIGTR